MATLRASYSIAPDILQRFNATQSARSVNSAGALSGKSRFHGPLPSNPHYRQNPHW